MFRFATIAGLGLLAAACATTPKPQVSYGNDALPSAEVVAFQAADARYRYREAKIEWDASRCAVYQGRNSEGRVASHPLVGADGRPICMP